MHLGRPTQSEAQIERGNIMYQIIKNTYPNNTVFAHTYGIAFTITYDDCIVVLSAIYDICQDQTAITQLVELCNRLQLDPIHLQDVVDDFLADQ